jgi:hypothetical protein
LWRRAHERQLKHLAFFVSKIEGVARAHAAKASVCKRSTDNSRAASGFLADMASIGPEIIFALGTSSFAHASFYRKQQRYQFDKSPKS